jgi:hypothetical protein
MSDYKLAKALHKKYYSNIPFGEFALKVSLDIEQALKEIREAGKMKIDPIILTVEFIIGFLVSFTITLMIFCKEDKQRVQ